MDLKSTIRSLPGWPSEEVTFRDLTTLMLDPEALRESCDRLYARYEDKKIDKIVGIDARGFVFGAVLAYRLGVGFIPVRKKGKLPYKTIEQSYRLEYGVGTLEIHTDAVEKGENILIVDDLLATGGTMEATIKLVSALGGNIVECAFIVELPDLGGREKLREVSAFSLTSFEGE